MTFAPRRGVGGAFMCVIRRWMVYSGWPKRSRASATWPSGYHLPSRSSIRGILRKTPLKGISGATRRQTVDADVPNHLSSNISMFEYREMTATSRRVWSMRHPSRNTRNRLNSSRLLNPEISSHSSVASTSKSTFVDYSPGVHHVDAHLRAAARYRTLHLSRPLVDYRASRYFDLYPLCSFVAPLGPQCAVDDRLH